MIRKQSAEEQLATMQRLIKFGVNENVSKNSAPVVEVKKKAANGKTYGIIREATKFYIMEAPQKDTEVLAEDFSYIGGFNNRKENEYSSFAKASNALDLKLMSINESVERQNRVVVETPKVNAEWENSITESMRKEIDRFKTITANVASILKEDKSSHGSIPSEHTLPEAPASNPSDEKVNSPYTDTAVANGDKDFKKEEHNHETAGTPFDTDGKVSNEKMQSDKKPVVKTEVTYLEKAEYVPDNTVADQHPSGGKVVRVNEGKKIRLKLTEEQVLAWNDNKNYMDTSKGTEIGSSAPFVDELGKESNQTEAPTEPIHEGESVVYDNPNNQNSPAPGTSEVGDGNPFEKPINEEVVDAEDAAGMPDEEDDGLPFPEVEDDFEDNDFEDDGVEDDGVEDDGVEFEIEPDEWEHDEFDDDIDLDSKKVDDLRYNNNGLKGLENWEDDWNKFDDDDDFAFESRRRRRNRLSEDKLNVWGKHPAYRKTPMTTPPNKEVAINGAREWDDESVQGEQPYGEKIGDSAPYDEVVRQMTESLVASIFRNKKKV